MIKKLNNNQVKVCCGRNGCPVVEKIDDTYYKVTDDNGNSIIVKQEELQLMGDAVNTLNDQKLICG